MRNPKRLTKMPCDKCGGETRVVDTYPTVVGVQRRRECTACGRRISSMERLLKKEKPQDIGAVSNTDGDSSI